IYREDEVRLFYNYDQAELKTMRKFIIAISTLYFIFYSEVSKASSDYYLNSLCASAEGSQVVDCYKNDLLASSVELKKAEKISLCA
ncbi:hypothetical protein ACSRCY_21985, partial [Salmonella enterica]